MRATFASSRRLWWGLPALLLVLWLCYSLVPLVFAELPEAPALTSVLLPVVRFARDVAAAITVGCVAVGALLVPGRSPRVLRWASSWALVWLVLLVPLLVLSVSEILAVTPAQALDATVLWSVLTQVLPGQVILWQVVCAATVAVLSRIVSSARGAWVLMAVALVGASLPAFASHGGLGGDHVALLVSLSLHVAAISLWVGGLVAVVTLLVVEPELAATLLPRFSALALGCVIVVAETGLLSGTLVAVSPAAFLSSDYGALVVGKVALLALLILLGWRHRQRTMPALTDDIEATTPSLFKLASWEFVWMGIAIAVGVALSRIGPAPRPWESAVFNPLTLALLAFVLPLTASRAFRPSIRHWPVRAAQAAPEVVAIVLGVVTIQTVGLSLLVKAFGRDVGYLISALLIVTLGWLFAVALQGQRARGGLVAAMLMWPVVAVACLAFGGSNAMLGGPDRRLAVAGVVLGEIALVVMWMIVAADRRASRESELHAVVADV